MKYGWSAKEADKLLYEALKLFPGTTDPIDLMKLALSTVGEENE